MQYWYALKIFFNKVFDWETLGSSKTRAWGTSTAVLTEVATAFCDRIKSAGYEPMIYFTAGTGYLRYDLDAMHKKGYQFWLAQYENAPTFYYEVDMWQYSDTTVIDGVKGNIDANLWFGKETVKRKSRTRKRPAFCRPNADDGRFRGVLCCPASRRAV